MTNRDFIAQNKSAKDKLKVLRIMGISTTPDDSKELNRWDKQRWIALVDFWLDRVPKQKVEVRLEQINNDERAANDER
ncbi:MAG TPA: hypothetical protein VEP90_01185 [Methylomirabilota bacterium]|nr:hypothetical protein [Methylomirabilota bacterium]